MAIKKTITNKNVKETDVKNETVSKTKKVNTKTKASKAKVEEVTKAEVEKTKAAKTKKIKYENKVDILNKDNHNLIDEVLEKKAKNEEKKAVALSKKEAKASAKAAAKAIKQITEEKGNKADSRLNKRSEVKENALKAEVKKFIEQKEINSIEENNNLSVISSFISGYKNIFNFKGRSSRFEFWSFALLNFLFACAITALIVWLSDKISDLATGSIFVLFGIVEMIAYLSLVVRRIHDTGHKAWKGFFAPIVYSVLVYFAILIYASKYNSIDKENFYLLLGLSGGALICVVIYLYYAIKTFVVAGFIEEETKDNEFGQVKLLDENHKCKLIRLMVTYFVIIILSSIIINSAFFVLSMYKGIGY